MKKITILGIILIVISILTVTWSQPGSIFPYISTFIRTLLDDPNAVTARSTLGVQASDTDLTAISALSTNGYAKRTGSGTWAIDANTYDTSGTAAATINTHKSAFDHNDIATALQVDVAASTYQPLTDMNDYLTTIVAGSTYQPLTDMNDYEASGAADAAVLAHNGAFDHNDIATALQITDVNNLVQHYSTYLDDLADGSLTASLVSGVADANYGAISVSDGVWSLNLEISTSDEAYGAGWDSDINAPTKNSIYDKVESILAGTYGLADSSSIDFSIEDGNVTASVDPSWLAAQTGDILNNVVTLTGVDANSTNLGSFTGTTLGDDETVKSAIQTLETAVEAAGVSTNKFYKFTIIQPDLAYNSDTQFCIDPSLGGNITVQSIKITCNANPDTELDWDLKYADTFIGGANATLVVAMDTTDGAASIDSGWNDNTIASGKALYAEWAVQAGVDVNQVCVSIEYTTTESGNEYYTANIVEPNQTYGSLAYVCLDPYVAANMTIDQVLVTCDVDPTAEPNMTLCFADTFIGKANETAIAEIVTASGVLSKTTDWGDNTVPAGKAVYLKWNEQPDADLKQVMIKIRYTND